MGWDRSVDELRGRGVVTLTGANGFLGRHLARDLLREGWRVRGTVRRSEACSELPAEIDPVVVADLLDVAAWRKAIGGACVVVHLIGRTHATRDRAADSLAEYRRVNVEGSQTVARAAVEQGVELFVYTSSIKAMGEERWEPYTESDPCRPESSYGVSKREAEEAVLRVAKGTGTRVLVLRPPLVYGPGVGANFLRLMRAVERGIPLPLASVDNRRSLAFVANVTAAIRALLETPGIDQEAFLVADPEAVSTPELIRRLARRMGKSSRLFPVPVPVLRALARAAGRVDTVERLVGSLTVSTRKLSRVTGWSASHTLEQGLERTVDWFLSRARAGDDPAR